MMQSSVQSRWRWILAVVFVGAGANHFLNPAPYVAMMPAWLPWPTALVAISGAAEIIGGVGLVVTRVQRVAAWGLIALLVAVFPANVNVAIYGWPGSGLPAWSLWARLPLQLVAIAWIHRICLRAERCDSAPVQPA